MGVLIGHPPGPETTRALLERIAGGEGARRLRAQVARWNTDATPEQIEDAFQEACARAEHACVGQMEGEVYNWLRTTTHREIAHQRRSWERERVIDVPVDDLELADRPRRRLRWRRYGGKTTPAPNAIPPVGIR